MDGQECASSARGDEVIVDKMATSITTEQLQWKPSEVYEEH